MDSQCEACGRGLDRTRYVFTTSDDRRIGPFGGACAMTVARALWKTGVVCYREGTRKPVLFRAVRWGGREADRPADKRYRGDAATAGPALGCGDYNASDPLVDTCDTCGGERRKHA